jgi:hypothetical protein
VTKQIDFHDLALDDLMISSTVVDVTARFSAPASFFQISSTLWPPYSAIAASMIVGVG